jgi:peptidase YpeB-like protein
MSSTRQGFPKALAALAVAIGIAGGSYGIASAASGSSSSSSSNTATATQPTASSQPWGGQRSDETLLTGDAESQVRAAALAKVPGGTIIRVETDADGHAAYEAHMTKSDGTPVTVYVDKSYNVVSVESR